MLVVRTDRFGETLLNLPLLSAIRAALPECHLTFMVQPMLRELLVEAPGVTEVVAAPCLEGAWWRRALRLARLWRSWKPDVIILSNAKKEHHAAAWLAGVPCRVGYDRKGGWCLTHRLPDRKALGRRHEVEYNLELLGALDLARPASPRLRLPVAEADRERLAQRLSGLQIPEAARLIAVHPWTSAPQKQWPVERFRALIGRLARLPEVVVVVIGGGEERAQAAALGLDDMPRVIDWVGATSLKELAALFQRVRLLVTNDSGPMHLAAAVGARVVALFGTAEAGSHPRRWGPWGAGHIVIHQPLERTTVEEVAERVQQCLAP